MTEHTSILPQTLTASPAVVKDVVPVQEPLQKMSIQFKLSIGAPDDPLEDEADAMADKVMRMPEQSFIQRKCAHCEEEENLQRKPMAPFIQKKESINNSATSDAVSNQVQSTKGSGNVMPGATKNFMESRFGADFSNINIHTGSYASQLSNQLNAQAFTVGNDIYFNEGKYTPETSEGKRLLAHELTHTLQQYEAGRPHLSYKIHRTPVSTYEKAGESIEQKTELGIQLKKMTLEELWAAAIATSLGTKYLKLLKKPPSLNWGSVESGARGAWYPDSNEIILNKTYKKLLNDNQWKQVIVMELGNASNWALFEEIRNKAHNGDLSRDDFMIAIEKAEFDVREKVLKSYLSGEFCNPIETAECVSIFPGGIMAFDLYIRNEQVKKHMEGYGVEWDKDSKAKYEQRHK